MGHLHRGAFPKGNYGRKFQLTTIANDVFVKRTP